MPVRGARVTGILQGKRKPRVIGTLRRAREPRVKRGSRFRFRT